MDPLFSVRERSQSFVEERSYLAGHPESSSQDVVSGCHWTEEGFFHALYKTMLHISLKEKPSATVAFNFAKKKYIQKFEAN